MGSEEGRARRVPCLVCASTIPGVPSFFVRGKRKSLAGVPWVVQGAGVGWCAKGSAGFRVQGQGSMLRQTLRTMPSDACHNTCVGRGAIHGSEVKKEVQRGAWPSARQAPGPTAGVHLRWRPWQQDYQGCDRQSIRSNAHMVCCL